jgi:hypothetical protein
METFFRGLLRKVGNRDSFVYVPFFCKTNVKTCTEGATLLTCYIKVYIIFIRLFQVYT